MGPYLACLASSAACGQPIALVDEPLSPDGGSGAELGELNARALVRLGMLLR